MPSPYSPVSSLSYQNPLLLPPSHPMQSSTIPPEDELVFLTLHHLHNYDSHPAVDAALSVLEQALYALTKFPKSHDYTGAHHQLTYQQCIRRYRHIPPAYLRDLIHTHLQTTSLSPPSLLATGRYAPAIRKRPRSLLNLAQTLNRPRRSKSPSRNVATLLARRALHPSSLPPDQISLTLLPKAYRRLKRLVGHHLPVFTTLFDHTARLIVTGSDDHLIKVWSADNAYLQHTLRGHDSNLVELVMHPTRPLVISASSDTTLHVWNINTGANLHVLDGGFKEVNAVQCSPCPDRPYLVSGGADGSLRLWNADHFEAGCIKINIPNHHSSRHATETQGTSNTIAASSIPTPPSPLSGSAHPPTPAMSAAAASSAPRASPEPPRTNAANSMVSNTPSYEVLSVCFNAGATRLAVSGTDCVAHVYAIDKPEPEYSPFPTVRLLTSLRGHSEHIIQVLFSRNGSTIVTACRDGTARIWNRTKAKLPSTRSKAHSVKGMGSWSYKVLDCRSQMQADAPSMLSGGASGSACGSIVPRMRRASFPVSVCAALWSLDDRYVFTATSDAKIRVWDAEAGQLARVLDAHEGEVYVLDCHPTNDRILLSAGYDGRVVLWDIETGAQLRSFSISDCASQDGLYSEPPMSAKRPSIVDGQFSCDGLSFVVSDTSGAINLFGIDSGEATALAPEEQFFSKDCAPFRRDERQRAIHESTNVLLHLAPKGRLCDRELRPHPPELQPNTLKHSSVGYEAVQKRGDSNTIASSKSMDYVRDPNCDALLRRAKEFRENQEKEEQRLIKEARNARRRMIMERERAELERDDGALFIPLRDFEVPDSDYDDSDDDFDGNAYMSDDSESTSSEEADEDENERERGEENEDEIQPLSRKGDYRASSRKQKDSSNPNRNFCRDRLRRLQRVYNTGPEIADSGESDEIRGEESHGYEVPLCRSDSEHSDSSNERGRLHSPEHFLELSRRTDEKWSEMHRDHHVRENLSRSNQECKYLTTSITNEQRGGEFKLVGAGSQSGKRKMRINIRNGVQQTGSGPPSTSASHLRTIRDVVGGDSRVSVDDQVRNHVHGPQSIGSSCGRINFSEAGGNAISEAPMNPSFTSERKRTGVRMEDHQGDSASCVRSEPMCMGPDSRSRTPPQDQKPFISYVERSPESQMKVEDENWHERILSVSRKAEGNEKSALSHSPTRLARNRWLSRTRNGSRKQKAVTDAGPVIDIDEVAERELEILDSEIYQRYRRKRKRRRSLAVGDDEYLHLGHDKRSKTDDLRKMGEVRVQPTRQSARGSDVMSPKDRGSGTSSSEVKSLEASTWLRSTSTPHTYVPQVGDDVMYFPGGHVAAMAVSRSSGLDPMLDKAEYKKNGFDVLDENSFGREQIPLRFQITDLRYDFPSLFTAKSKNMGSRKGGKRSMNRNVVKPKTKVILTLHLLTHLERRSGQFGPFVLCYFPVDAPEYLVLTSRVEMALSRTWTPADRFRILFLNEKRAWQYYTGSVRTVKPTIRTTMWNSIMVEYDTESGREKENVDLVSPWELESYDVRENSRHSHAHQGTILKASTVEPGLFPIIARELLAMKQMESSWKTELLWFETADSLAAVEGYCSIIPCPMDFNTVLVRLCTGYYRHFSAFLYDIFLLKNNAIRSHGPNSEASRLADNAFSRIIEMAERVCASQSVGTWMPFPHQAQTHQAGTNAAAQSSCRMIRPRPWAMEGMGPSGFAPAQPLGSVFARQAPAPAPAPLAPREPLSGVMGPLYPQSDGSSPIIASTQHSRAWNSSRIGAPNVHSSYHHSHPSFGVGLPPAVPGVSSSGAQSRATGRGMKANTRSHGGRYRSGSGSNNYRSSQTGGYASSASIFATAGSLQPICTPPLGSAPYPPQVSHGLQPGVRRVTNSTQTNLAPRQFVRFISPMGPMQNSNASRVGSRLSTPIVHSPFENTMETTSKIVGCSEMASPPPEHIGHHSNGIAITDTHHRSPMPILSRPSRAGSSAGDGGTNSWARSMEGAGGAFHLQADSHLPAPFQGRSQSPISPAPVATDASHRNQRRQAAFGRGTIGSHYQEYTTTSNAVAESTMSCGGAEVAQHAATAESAENGSAASRLRRTAS